VNVFTNVDASTEFYWPAPDPQSTNNQHDVIYSQWAANVTIAVSRPQPKADDPALISPVSAPALPEHRKSLHGANLQSCDAP
jgi:hypothetical protein